MKPLLSRSLRYTFNACCSLRARLYKPPNGGSQFCLSSIAQSKDLWGGNTESCGEKTCEYFAQEVGREDKKNLAISGWRGFERGGFFGEGSCCVVLAVVGGEGKEKEQKMWGNPHIKLQIGPLLLLQLPTPSRPQIPNNYPGLTS